MRKHGITTLELSLDHPLGSSNKIKICNAGFHGWRKNYVQGQDPTTILSLCDAKFENQVCTTVGGGGGEPSSHSILLHDPKQQVPPTFWLQ